MVRIQLRLKAVSPVAFSARRGTSNFVDTLDYVPGSALRGAVAAHYLSRIGGAGDARFQTILVKGEASFGNLYPVRLGLRSSVIPSTARSCKTFDGFLSDRDKHGVFDSLMAAASARLSGNFAALDERARCTVTRCGLPTHRFSGFYEEKAGDSGGTPPALYSKVDVSKRHVTHAGINRASQSAEPGFLYAQQVINESWREGSGGEFKPQVFAGDLLVREHQADYVRSSLLPRGTVLRLGDSRSRGLGRMEVDHIGPAETDTETTVRGRIREFNKRLAEKAGVQPNIDYISLTLQSDAIITDSFLRYETTIEGEDISRAIHAANSQCGIEARGFHLVFASADKKLVQSWNAASGYPKPDAAAITMGSVFLFKLLNGKAAELAQPLLALQESGIGQRRSEGFGRLSICDSFHWEVQEHGQPAR